MKKINWAILGLGAIAKEFAQTLIKLNGSIYAAGSRSIEKAERFAESFNITKLYGDYGEMLSDPIIDAVYIATPHCSHDVWIRKALEAGKHVLCEKAITVNSKQLSQMIQLADKNHLILAEAMTIYHMPLYKKLKERILEGAIGKLKMVQVNFGSCKEYDVTNRFFSPELAGGALLDIGTYALSFARYFLSEQPDELLTNVKYFETGVDEQSGIILKNKLDQMAVVTLTMRAKMPKRGVVTGTLGHIIVEEYPRAAKAVIVPLNGEQEVIEYGNAAEALAYEVKHMEECIHNSVKSDTLCLSSDVMDIMTRVREQWGMKYPFEQNQER